MRRARRRQSRFTKCALSVNQLIDGNHRARRDPEVEAAIGPMRKLWHEQLAEILGAGMGDGNRLDSDADAGASMIAGVLSSVRRHPQLLLEQFDRACDELLPAFTSPA